MYDPNSKGLSYTGGFFMLIGFTVAGLLMANLLSMPVWTMMTGQPFDTMEKGITNPAYSNAAKVVLCLNSIIGFFLPAMLTAYLLNRKPMKLIGFPGKMSWIQFALVLAIVVTALYVSQFLSYVSDLVPISAVQKVRYAKMENEYIDQISAVIGLRNFGEYLIALFVIGFIPALCEETLFRGGLQNFLTRATNKPIFSILVVSILFSLAHISFYGFLSRFFLGLVLGLIYQYSGRIWLNIFAHFLNNALAVTVIYYYTTQGKSLHESMAEKSTTWIGILALPILIIVFSVFRNFSKGFLRNEESKINGI